jgi:rod shape-determining protein MreD
MWKHVLWLSGWLLLALLLQATVVPVLGGFLGRLDLVLAVVVSVALLHGHQAGAGFGLIAGLLRDVVLGFGLGFYATVFFIIGYSIGHLSRLVFRDSILVPLLAGLTSSVAFWMLLTVGQGFLYGHWIAGRYWRQLLIVLLANGLAIPAVYALIRRQDQRLVARSRGE